MCVLLPTQRRFFQTLASCVAVVQETKTCNTIDLRKGSTNLAEEGRIVKLLMDYEENKRIFIWYWWQISQNEKKKKINEKTRICWHGTNWQLRNTWTWVWISLKYLPSSTYLFIIPPSLIEISYFNNYLIIDLFPDSRSPMILSHRRNKIMELSEITLNLRWWRSFLELNWVPVEAKTKFMAQGEKNFIMIQSLWYFLVNL